MKAGYWALHEYHRLNVEDYVEGFCGWQSLKQLIEYAGTQRNKAFIATLFLTGGRISEVLPLRKDNFEMKEEKGVILVKDMRLLKRYKKLGEVEVEGKRKWLTELQYKKRKSFPIKLDEPLTPILLEWLRQPPPKWLRQNPSRALLFPSPYKIGQPLSRFWAYKLVISIDKALPEKLREQLGLNKKLVVNGKETKKTIHLWLHWFRSQRASQLVSDYSFEVIDLIDFFDWKQTQTAVHYAHQKWSKLADKMQRRRQFQGGDRL